MLSDLLRLFRKLRLAKAIAARERVQLALDADLAARLEMWKNRPRAQIIDIINGTVIYRTGPGIPERQLGPDGQVYFGNWSHADMEEIKRRPAEFVAFPDP